MTGVPSHDSPLLAVEDLTVTYPPRRSGGQALKALDGVSLTLGAGEVLGVVGESGSGKTTLAGALVGLVAPTSGSLRHRGLEIVGADQRTLARVRRDVQMVFQDASGSLDPSFTVLQCLSEPARVHMKTGRRETRRLAADLLEQVGLDPSLLGVNVRRLSGGQQQRVAVARALVPRPSLLVCDEITSALDMSVQNQVLNLMLDLRRAMGLSYVFISHNLAAVRSVATHLLVMKGGRAVEYGPSAEVLSCPSAEYTRELLAAEPTIGGSGRHPGAHPAVTETVGAGAEDSGRQ